MLKCISFAIALAAVVVFASCKEEPTKAGANAAPSAPAGLPAPPDVAAPPADATKSASGLASKVISPGSGKDHPRTFDSVKLVYTGWTPDGKMFGTSTDRGRPVRIGVKGAIPGWIEALQLMVEGEKRRLWVPASLLGKGWPETPKGTMVVFDVELSEIIKGKKPIPVPEDVAAPPADAKKTKSGLKSKVLKEGEGKRHPKASDTVKVHYSGWTTDGKMFDSSEAKGTPAEFPLGAVIAGWTEGVQLMVEGEKRRFWIPVNLAYAGAPGKPQGMLVFDIELLEILDKKGKH